MGRLRINVHKKLPEADMSEYESEIMRRVYEGRKVTPEEFEIAKRVGERFVDAEIKKLELLGGDEYQRQAINRKERG